MNGDTSSDGGAAAPPHHNARLVSFEEHEQGWKELELESRSGRKTTVRLWAMDADRAAKLSKHIFSEGASFDLLIAECLVDPATATAELRANAIAELATLRRRLVPGAWGLLCDLCIALTYGETFAKKLQEVAAKMGTVQMPPSATSPAPASPASAPVSIPPTSAAGPSPG